MIYPEIDPNEWIARHALPVRNYLCPKCNGTFKTTVPVIAPGYVGVETPVHNCGKEFTRVILKVKSDAKKDLWAKVI